MFSTFAAVFLGLPIGQDRATTLESSSAALLPFPSHQASFKIMNIINGPFMTSALSPRRPWPSDQDGAGCSLPQALGREATTARGV